MSSCSRALCKISRCYGRTLVIVSMRLPRSLPRTLAGPYTGLTHAVRTSARLRKQLALQWPEKPEECVVATAVHVVVDVVEAPRRSAGAPASRRDSAWTRSM